MFNAFEVESARGEKRACAELRKRFSSDRETRFTRSVTYYDTFEWKLYRRGTTLSEWRSRDQPVVCWHACDGRVLHRMLGVPLPGFAHKMPAGAFRDALMPCAEIRRLLPVVRVELRSTELRILDENRKTVVRALFERGFALRPGAGNVRRRLPGTLTVAGLRGYEKDSERVARFVEDEIGLQPAEPSPLVRALGAVGRKPGGIETRFRVALDPAMTAEDATREVLRRLFDTVRLTEDGLREDLDSEFLHDFRVAVRRTRAALGQLKLVLSEESTARYRDDFKWLGTLTGPTRDLDVYLLKLPDYRGMLPRELQADLGPLEELLVLRQREEHGRLVAGLDGERYRALMRDWPKFLARASSRDVVPSEADRPALQVASERIRRAYRRVLKRGRQAEASPSVEQLHRLRLDCKKLRYLLEFFTSLFDEKRVKRLIAALKKLQDNLGDFNDLHLQQRALEGYGRELTAAGPRSERTLIAVGRLVERLATEQERKRREFEKRFDQFSSAENQADFRSLFGKRALRP